MSDVKVFKDPIYGYIEVENDLIKKVIDKPAFQRLRRIIQTSYSPLYASAIHNRFTHSLGVYHLGKIAITSILEKKPDMFSFSQDLDKVFLYACLLHDVGHAPFSHTGENYYLPSKNDYSAIHEHLINVVDSSDFTNDVPVSDSTNPQSIKAANPHEIMSAIIGITQFPELFASNEDKSFFARAIVGYPYKEKNTNNEIKNCLISLLNSKYIDVDKLDYLMRDKYMTGFESINIDYMRLLKSLDIIIDDTLDAHLVFEKNAISVIENVVYARDLEKKWIQIHPAVLYDIYILEQSIEFLKNKLDVVDASGSVQRSLFSYETLLETGATLNDGVSIRLLCDDDLIYLLKNKYNTPFFKEYLNRNLRKHPLWKSESEYKSYFINTLTPEEQTRLDSALKQLAKLLKKLGREKIDEELINMLEQEINEANSMVTSYKIGEDTSNLPDLKSISVGIKDKKEMLHICKPLQQFSNENNIPFSYILLQSSLFYSAFGNDDFSKIKIVFKRNDYKSIKLFGDIASFSGKKSKLEDFYYFFYERTEEIQDFDINDLIKKIKVEYID